MAGLRRGVHVDRKGGRNWRYWRWEEKEGRDAREREKREERKKEKKRKERKGKERESKGNCSTLFGFSKPEFIPLSDFRIEISF